MGHHIGVFTINDSTVAEIHIGGLPNGGAILVRSIDQMPISSNTDSIYSLKISIHISKCILNRILIAAGSSTAQSGGCGGFHSRGTGAVGHAGGEGEVTVLVHTCGGVKDVTQALIEGSVQG